MSDLVVLTHKDLPGQPISVPESAVAGHEVYGWRRAKKSLQAEAEAIHDEAAAPAVAVPDDSNSTRSRRSKG